MASPQSSVPSYQYPFLNKDGTMTTAWYNFFINIWNRTGGAVPSGNVQSVAATGHNGVSTTVTEATSNPTITIGLGDITPSSIDTTTITTNNLVANNAQVTGTFQYGTFVSATPTPNGYIGILDSTGTPRHLLIG